MGQSFQGSFTGGELDPSLAARIDLSKYGVGCKDLTNFIVQAHGGVYRRPGMDYIVTALGATRLIPFQYNVEQAYILAFSNLKMRVIKDGGVVLDSSASTTITAATKDDPCQITATGHGLVTGDDVYISGVGGMTELNGRFFRVTRIDDDIVTLDDLDSTSYTTFTSGGTIAKLYTLTTTYATADLNALSYAQSADVLYICHASYAPRTLTRADHDDWTLATMTFAAGIVAPAGSSAAWTDGAGVPPHVRDAFTISYRVTALNAAGEESLQSSAFTVSGYAPDEWILGNFVTITIGSVSGATEYNVYKQINGIHGYIGTARGTTTFRDDNFDPDLTYTPATANNTPLSGADNYPATVTFFKQRLWFAGSNNNPTTLYATQIANFTSFNESLPLRDSDGLEFSLAATQVNDIRWLVPFGDLLVGTSGAEWQIFSTTDEAITPSTTSAKLQSQWGSARRTPIVVGDSIVHVQAQGGKLRDLFYSLEKDSYSGNDLTVMVSHLFQGKSLVSWAYQRSPDSVIWCVMDDGSLYGLTYHKEHQVWGWHKHTSPDGSYESVAVIPGDTFDDAYFVVNRGTINGVANTRFIEKMNDKWRLTDGIENAKFLDACATYDGAEATTISGIDHLEGETVQVMVDGSPVLDYVVSDGQIVLASAGEVVHVGYQYDSTFAPMGVEQIGQEAGTVGRVKSMSKIIVRFAATVGGKIGPFTDYTDPLKFKPEVYGQAITPDELLDYEFIPPASYSRDGSFYIIQDQALPMTILAIIPEFSIGGM